VSQAPAKLAPLGAPAAEDQARANFYALLSRLYAAAPDEALLATIAAADPWPAVGEGAAFALATSWRALSAASAATDAATAEDEYQRLFIGVGRCEVSLHASAYLAPTATSPLAELRAALARLGLSRREEVNVYEDHLAAICETMRVLIAGAPGIEPATIAQQREFFAVYVAPWVTLCCDAINTAAIANYYRRVAEFTVFFIAIERDSFAID